MTVHDDIDNLLAADLHGELSETERQELQSHLLDCATCRQAFQETKIMNQLLEEKLEKLSVASACSLARRARSADAVVLRPDADARGANYGGRGCSPCAGSGGSNGDARV